MRLFHVSEDDTLDKHDNHDNDHVTDTGFRDQWIIYDNSRLLTHGMTFPQENEREDILWAV